MTPELSVHYDELTKNTHQQIDQLMHNITQAIENHYRHSDNYGTDEPVVWWEPQKLMIREKFNDTTFNHGDQADTMGHDKLMQYFKTRENEDELSIPDEVKKAAQFIDQARTNGFINNYR